MLQRVFGNDKIVLPETGLLFREWEVVAILGVFMAFRIEPVLLPRGVILMMLVGCVSGEVIRIIYGSVLRRVYIACVASTWF